LRVPDEVGHFWRSVAIAWGHFSTPPRAKTPIPTGMQTLVWVMSSGTAQEGRFNAPMFRTAATIPLEAEKPARVLIFPTHYTPLPYLPQVLASIAVRMTGARPLIAFYAGRLASLLASIALIALAMRIAPRHASLIAAVALLPMSMFEIASWSADALTIALALLFSAMLFEPPASTTAVALTAIALSLCKPAYFLLALLAFTTMPRRRAAIIAAATMAGTAVSVIYARHAWFNTRITVPLDPGAQLRCILADPLRFMHIMLHDVATNSWSYTEQMIGRLGLLDVGLPLAVIVVELVALVTLAMTADFTMRWTQRVLIAAIVVASVAGILVSQYLSWSIVCSDVIEGVQGRYFLPLLPATLAALVLPSTRWRLGPKSLTAVVVICNAVAIAALLRRHWL
jgi:uncharacterized membrane protein